MGCSKCSKGKCLCPFSLGVAIGVTCALGVLFWSAWAMFGGTMPAMANYMEPATTWGEAGMRALWALAKGFVCGFVIALVYDVISCFCKGKCCKQPDGDCACSCNKPDMQK